MSLKPYCKSDINFEEKWLIKHERRYWRDFEKNLKKVINSPNNSTISSIGMVVIIWNEYRRKIRL
jgi:hypothetical protein